MKLNTLDRATKIYELIKKLDAEIMSIEKRANELASGNFEINVRFKFKDKDKKDKAKFDSDGSLLSESDSRLGFYTFPSLMWGAHEKPKEDDSNKLELIVNEQTALYMIGALLSIKQNERKQLVNEIRELGYI